MADYHREVNQTIEGAKSSFCDCVHGSTVKGSPVSYEVLHRLAVSRVQNFKEDSFSMGAYSKLHNATYRELKDRFPGFTIRENIRPEWLMSSNLTRLELDIYIEEINTAIEIQGLQHYEFVPYFHKTYENFESQKKRDQEKRDLCYGRKVRLVEIAAYIDLDIFLKELVPNQRKGSPTIKKAKESIMRSDEERKKEKNSRKTFRPLPGSKKQRRHARVDLNINLMMDGRWVVWGGDSTHIMTQDGNEIRCSCPHAKEDIGNICSHTIKFKINNGTFPKRTKEKL